MNTTKHLLFWITTTAFYYNVSANTPITSSNHDDPSQQELMIFDFQIPVQQFPDEADCYTICQQRFRDLADSLEKSEPDFCQAQRQVVLEDRGFRFDAAASTSTQPAALKCYCEATLYMVVDRKLSPTSNAGEPQQIISRLYGFGNLHPGTPHWQVLFRMQGHYLSSPWNPHQPLDHPPFSVIRHASHPYTVITRIGRTNAVARVDEAGPSNWLVGHGLNLDEYYQVDADAYDLSDGSRSILMSEDLDNTYYERPAAPRHEFEPINYAEVAHPDANWEFADHQPQVHEPQVQLPQVSVGTDEGSGQLIHSEQSTGHIDNWVDHGWMQHQMDAFRHAGEGFGEIYAGHPLSVSPFVGLNHQQPAFDDPVTGVLDNHSYSPWSAHSANYSPLL